MNCQQVEELMPLFVEGDLPVDEEMSVAAHLQNCAACTQLSGEYEKSQNWLRSYTPPEFDAAFFADLKRNVMQEVAVKGPRTIFFERVIGKLRGRWLLQPAYAAYALVALLLLAGALTLFYLKRGDGQPAQAAEVQKPKPEMTAPPLRPEKPEEPVVGDQKLVAGARPRRRPRFTQPKTRTPVEEPLPEVVPEMAFDLTAPDDDWLVGSLLGLPEGRTAPAKDVLRIEFQTSDPNIRIIWFAPKPADQDARKIDTE